MTTAVAQPLNAVQQTIFGLLFWLLHAATTLVQIGDVVVGISASAVGLIWHMLRQLHVAEEPSRTDNVAHQVRNLREETSSLKTIPKHLSYMLLGEDASVKDLARLSQWAFLLGVRVVSVFDVVGNVKKRANQFQTELDREGVYLREAGFSVPDVDVVQCAKEELHTNGNSTKGIVLLMGGDDGRRDVLDATLRQCQEVQNGKVEVGSLDVDALDQSLNLMRGLPEPDLVIRFGDLNTVSGYPPWQMRLSEICSIPSNQPISMESFRDVLYRFNKIDRRFGK